MGSINFTGMQATPTKKYLYKDIALDFNESDSGSSKTLHKSKQAIDLEESLDELAIKNSIVNLFNTVPGERLLDPEFGISIRRFLFEPLSTDIAEMIGESILEGIARYEPRVRVESVEVLISEMMKQYTVSLILTIPQLNISNKQYDGFLKPSGFSLL